MLRYFIQLLLLKQVATSPIKNVDYADDFDGSTSCTLPAYLDRLGTITYLEDCKADSMKRFQLPVPVISSFTGYAETPRICCPKGHGKEPICLPSDPYCKSYDEADAYDESYEGDYSYADYIQGDSLDLPTISQLESLCPSDYSECTSVTRCGNVSPAKNAFCGLQDGEPKVCCASSDVLEKSLGGQNPRYPAPDTGLARSCDDKTEFCATWQANGACDLNKHFETGSGGSDQLVVASSRMFTFMTLSCTQSCGWCGEKGCVDLHGSCGEWVRQGLCSLPDSMLFMNHICRESCGLCGFLSANSVEEQVLDDKSYSDIEAPDFHCGRFKDLEELEKAGVRVDPGQADPDVSFSITDKDECAASVSDIGISGDADYRDTGNEDYDELLDIKLSAVYCGTTIISDRWLVTAAHCQDNFAKTNQIEVQQVRNLLPDFQDVIPRRKIYRHPYYTFNLLYNDIALIELSRRIVYNFTEFGDTPSCVNTDTDVSQQTALVTGFGKNDQEVSGETILVTNTTVIDSDECQQRMMEYLQNNEIKKRTFCRSLKYGIQEDHICGIGNPYCYNGEIKYSGSCKGDSGGPVEVKKNGKTTLVGVVSGSISCASQAPEYFTNVFRYRKWISCIIQNAKGNKKSEDEVQNACLKFANPPVMQVLDICKNENI